MADQAHPPAGRDDWVLDDGAFPDVVTQLAEYFDGDRTTFDLAFAPQGTEFQHGCGPASADPYGETWTYGQLADTWVDPARRGRWAWPTGATPSASSSPVIG